MKETEEENQKTKETVFQDRQYQVRKSTKLKIKKKQTKKKTKTKASSPYISWRVWAD